MKINVNNTEALQKAIDAVQSKRITARTIYPEDILEAVSYIEKRLTSLLYKKDWKGLKVQCDPNAQSFPNSYNGNPESTQFTLERTATNWIVTSVVRYYCKGLNDRYIITGLKDKATELASFITKTF